ncbi:MAG: DUF998 domain-containing protein [archaeon]|nr:DUF998 domain-containing protein [archaeon]
MEKFNKIYDKIPGSTYGLIAFIVGVSMLSMSMILHMIGSPFSLMTHWVSNMGIAPLGGRFFFNYGLITLGILIIPFVLYMPQFLWANKESKYYLIKNFFTILGFISSICSIIGMILVGLYPMDMVEQITYHGIGAMFAFMGAILFLSFYSISMMLNKKGGFIPFILSILALISMILMIATMPTFDLENIDLSVLTETGDPLIARFWEWMVFFIIFIDLGISVMQVRKHEKK